MNINILQTQNLVVRWHNKGENVVYAMNTTWKLYMT